MSSLILHQYQLSPFSAKLRAMLGYAQLPWQSCLTSEMPPRPELTELTGGYRKIPVAQLGADIFCDTRCISEEIARQSGQAQLNHATLSQDALDLATQAESQIFFAALMLCPSWSLLRKSAQAMSIKNMGKFMQDRIQVGRSARVTPIKPRHAKPMVHAFLADLERRLEQDFLFSEQANAADFSAYVSLWIVHVLAEKTLLKDYPKTRHWMDRVNGFDANDALQISADESLDIAMNNSPRDINPQHQSGALQGRTVTVSPSDYARDGSTGVLVGETDSRWILQRETPHCGELHVHFPKLGFELTEA